MLTIHHLGVSQSERIVWLCEELGVPYELKRYARDPSNGLAPAEFRALHPLGTAPIIVDGDLMLPESGAIMEYIIAKYGQGRLAVGPDKPNFAEYLFWMHFANGSFMPAIMFDTLIPIIGADLNHPYSVGLRARATSALDYIEQRLAKSPYFAGDEFTAADIIMVFPLTTMRTMVPRDLSAYPALSAYLNRLVNRPAYKRAMAKCDPDVPILGG